jgi:hypothetical protein
MNGFKLGRRRLVHFPQEVDTSVKGDRAAHIGTPNHANQTQPGAP